MSDPNRTWQDIARELASEDNPLRCTEQTMEEEEHRKCTVSITAVTPGKSDARI